MSKCLKCGASLPPVGDCPACAAATLPARRAVPHLLDKEIPIDRRRAERDDGEPPTLPVENALPPGMIVRPNAPPGMMPAPRAPAAPPGARPGMPAPPPATAVARRAPAPGLPVMPPRAPPPPAPAPMKAADDEGFSVDVDEELAPDTLPATATPALAPVPRRPAPAPVAAAPTPAPAPAPARARPVPAATPAPAASGEVHARPASLWRRLVAFGIDTAAVMGVVSLYLLLASSVAGVHKAQTNLTGLDAFLLQVRALQSVLLPGVVLLLVLALVYCAVSAFLWNGRTLGRRLLGLRLVDTRGLAPAPGRAIVRAMLASLSFGLFLAGFWMALFDRRGQTLHDKLTSTFVVQPS